MVPPGGRWRGPFPAILSTTVPHNRGRGGPVRNWGRDRGAGVSGPSQGRRGSCSRVAGRGGGRVFRPPPGQGLLGAALLGFALLAGATGVLVELLVGDLGGRGLVGHVVFLSGGGGPCWVPASAPPSRGGALTGT